MSLSAPCTFLPCPPTSLNSLTSAVDHLESIHHNGLKIFLCVLVFGSGQLAVQLLLRICLLFSPARIGISQLWHTYQLIFQLLKCSLLFLLPTKRYVLLTQYVEGLCSNKKFYPKMNYLLYTLTIGGECVLQRCRWWYHPNTPDCVSKAL